MATIQNFSRHSVIPQKTTDAEGGAAAQKRYGLRSKRAPLSSIQNQNAAIRSQKAQKSKSDASPGSSTVYENTDEPTMMSLDHTALLQQAARPACVPDIDEEGKSDPQLVGDYAGVIYQHMLRQEAKFQASPQYMASQDAVNEKMRGVLVDWLVEVHLRFDLLPETLFLTTLLIDRYLSKDQVSKSKLQLVGVTGMLIASKYEEMWPPEIQDFVYMTDNAYTKTQIIEMEGKMLRTLDFSLGNPLPSQFFSRYSQATKSSEATNAIASYAMELTISNYNMISYRPSMLAASAMVISLEVQGLESWSESLQHYSGYTKAQLQPCIDAVNGMLRNSNTSSLKAVKKKHQKTKFKGTSARSDVVAYCAKLAAQN